MRFYLIITGILICGKLAAQGSGESDKGHFSGNLLLNTQKYMRDDRIGATTKVYRENSTSIDAWLFLNYRIKGYSFSVRYDHFNSSPLLNPQGSYTNHGIGFWQVSKQIDNLEITAGSFYDQFGNGILFRAYEQRQLGIDYAIQGVHLKYKLGNNWTLKGFSGNQKGNIDNRFGHSNQVINGFNAEGMIDLGSGGQFGSLSLGGSALNRALDRPTMDGVVAEINSYDLAKRFIPKYNTYGFNGYFTYYLGALSWNVEYNYKTPEAIRKQDNTLASKDGRVLYTSLSWGNHNFHIIGKKKASIGISLQARHIAHFSMRTTPNEILLNGAIAYLPSLTRQNTYRLLARYNAPAQEPGENGIQGEIDFKPMPGTQITLNGSYVKSLPENGIAGKSILLFREAYGEVLQKLGKHMKLKLGLQSIEYNQARYEQEPEYENVKTITPFGEVLYNFMHGRALRFEFQYLHTDKDQGSFGNAILEYFFSKNLSFAVGDMVNVKPHRYSNMVIANQVLHYPSIFTSYTEKNTVFTLAYLKQQQGVNCSGGICRVEPAFSGVRFTVSSNF
ncbi:MAG: hypothetical protein JNL57_06810 [Bacteroidetes bacterium]|nr:hypothetical protein [Bacteroidota bacterium]